MLEELSHALHSALKVTVDKGQLGNFKESFHLHENVSVKISAVSRDRDVSSYRFVIEYLIEEPEDGVQEAWCVVLADAVELHVVRCLAPSSVETERAA